MSIFALDFPAVTHLFEWPDIALSDTYLALNKTSLIYLVGMILTVVTFGLAARKRALVPSGVQHVAEGGINFVEQNIVMQTIGSEGRRFMPFLTSLFFFIFFVNIFEVIPFIQFPGNSRMAVPLLLALVVWVIYN